MVHEWIIKGVSRHLWYFANEATCKLGILQIFIKKCLFSDSVAVFDDQNIQEFFDTWTHNSQEIFDRDGESMIRFKGTIQVI